MLIRSSEAMVFSCFVATKLCVLWISLVCHGMSKLRNQQNMVVVDLRGEDRDLRGKWPHRRDSSCPSHGSPQGDPEICGDVFGPAHRRIHVPILGP